VAFERIAQGDGQVGRRDGRRLGVGARAGFPGRAPGGALGPQALGARLAVGVGRAARLEQRRQRRQHHARLADQVQVDRLQALVVGRPAVDEQVAQAERDDARPGRRCVAGRSMPPAARL
jgi:hypothetical protein